MVIIGIGLGYAGLAGVYLALGRQRVVFRILISTGIALAGGAIGAAGEGHDYQNWCGVMLFGAFAIAVPLIYLWARGLRITHPDHPPIVYWKPRAQFSLWGMLSLTTCLAVLLAVAMRLQFPIFALYAVVVICSCAGGLAYVSTGTLLSNVSPAWPLLAIPAGTVVSAFALSSIGGGGTPLAPAFAAAIAAAVVNTATMLILRIAGYRLQWPDYAAIETVGPTKRLVDPQGEPIEMDQSVVLPFEKLR
jgi:hypothetical protein